MKRLTDKRLAIPPGQWQEVTHEEARELKEIPVPSMQDLYYRLSQIEDILCDGTDEYDLDRLSVLCNQRMTMREEVSQRFSLTAKIPLDRLRELVEADREGRCVVLPCKVEDDVYINIFRRTLTFTVISISQMASTPTFKAQHGIRLVYIFKADDVGETVFMTREEAEAALAKIATDCD